MALKFPSCTCTAWLCPGLVKKAQAVCDAAVVKGSWKKPGLFSIDFVFAVCCTTAEANGSRPRRKMMERKKLLRRILHVQMLLLELGALLHGSPDEPL